MMAMVKLDQHTTPQGNEAADLVENYEMFGDPQFNRFVQQNDRGASSGWCQ